MLTVIFKCDLCDYGWTSECHAGWAVPKPDFGNGICQTCYFDAMKALRDKKEAEKVVK